MEGHHSTAAANRLPALIKRAIEARGGATAVEFALIAAPFFALLIATLEIGLISFAQEALQTATSEAGRTIMTGSAQAQNMTAAQFRQAVCNNASALFDCSNLYVNVQTSASFGGVTMLNPLVGGNVNPALMNFSPGNPGDIVLVQAFYVWPVVLGPLNFNMSNMSGNNRLLVATAVFRNEPWGILH